MYKYNFLNLVLADNKGNIKTSSLKAAGFFLQGIKPLTRENTIKIPRDTLLYFLPERNVIRLNKNYEFSIGAILPSGYLRTYYPTYQLKIKNYNYLPFFSYSAVGADEKYFYVSAIKIDDYKPWTKRNFSMDRLKKQSLQLIKKYADNRLYKHLQKCALEYSCVTAQNIFLQKYEGAIPVSPTCNANCEGCISKNKKIYPPPPQQRIIFIPNFKEIYQVAYNHLIADKNNFISFGQGCEGEPLMQYKLITEIIKNLKKDFPEAIFHINTNGSKPKYLKELIKIGLNSARISFVSCDKDNYNLYHQPKNYNFKDVLHSIEIAKNEKVRLYLNLLCFPGFSDSQEESEKFFKVVNTIKPFMIQLRDLNLDPEIFKKIYKNKIYTLNPIGIENFYLKIKNTFKDIKLGMFNRPFQFKD